MGVKLVPQFPSKTLESEHVEAIVLDVSLDIWQDLFSPNASDQMEDFSTKTVELGCMVSIEFLRKEPKQSKLRKALLPLNESLNYAESLNYSHVFLRIG